MASDDRTSGDLADLSAEFVSVYVTAESEDVAMRIATTLVHERLVACANVNTGTRSIYQWDDTMQLDTEVTVIMKTTIDNVETMVDRIKEMHSYEVPCVTVSPIIGGNIDYLKWVQKQVR